MALSIGGGIGGISGGVSLGPGGISAGASIGGLSLSTTSGVGIFAPHSRSIGPIVAQVTIQEQERDELTVTEHPLEQGAPIADHAFKRPSEVTIRAGWSAQWAGDLTATGGGVYAQLLGLQASLVPFDLHTGKRVYPDMLIGSLTVTTDEHSEFALMADITCRQIILVRTSTGQAAISSDKEAQKDPENTAKEDSKGDQQSRDVGKSGDYGGGGDNENPKGFTSVADKHDDTATATATQPSTIGGPASNQESSAASEIAAHEAAFPAVPPEADKVGNKAGENSPPTSGSVAHTPLYEIPPMMVGRNTPQAPYMQQLRRREWQRRQGTSRFRRNRAARSRSA
jgi:hypothetical protein